MLHPSLYVEKKGRKESTPALRHLVSEFTCPQMKPSGTVMSAIPSYSALCCSVCSNSVFSPSLCLATSSTHSVSFQI